MVSCHDHCIEYDPDICGKCFIYTKEMDGKTAIIVGPKCEDCIVGHWDNGVGASGVAYNSNWDNLCAELDYEDSIWFNFCPVCGHRIK